MENVYHKVWKKKSWKIKKWHQKLLKISWKTDFVPQSWPHPQGEHPAGNLQSLLLCAQYCRQD